MLDKPQSNVMTEVEYDRHRATLRELYGDGRGSERAKHEQALAELFVESRWTLEKLAKREGRHFSLISRQLRFGRFLNHVSGSSVVVLPASLVEGRFSAYWRQTGKGHAGGKVALEPKEEHARFAEVLKLIEADEELRTALDLGDKRKRPSIIEPLIKSFADGQWHSHEAMAKSLKTTSEHVATTLAYMTKTRRGAAYRCERKRVGASWHERIFPPDPVNRQISSVELREKFAPLIDGLITEGRKDLATFSPNTVRRYGSQMKQLLDVWTSEKG